MAHEIERQAVYVLNRRIYQESSLIIDVFSMQYGRMSLIAKGALKSKKQWSAMLQVFQPLLVSWLGRSTLKTLKSVEAPSKPFSFKSDRLFCAYYLNELILNLLPESEPNAEIFALYAASLQSLEERQEIEPVLRGFEFQFLSYLGLLPDFLFDNQNQGILPESFYRYDYRNGFTQLDRYIENTGVGSAALMNHSLEFKGSSLLFIAEGQFFSDQTAESHERYLELMGVAKRLMRVLVSHALDGKELKSKNLFRQLIQQRTKHEKDN